MCEFRFVTIASAAVAALGAFVDDSTRAVHVERTPQVCQSPPAILSPSVQVSPARLAGEGHSIGRGEVLPREAPYIESLVYRSLGLGSPTGNVPASTRTALGSPVRFLFLGVVSMLDRGSVCPISSPSLCDLPLWPRMTTVRHRNSESWLYLAGLATR